MFNFDWIKISWADLELLYTTREGMVGTAVALAVLFCCCGYCWNRLCKKRDTIVASERFKWPNKHDFLMKTLPARPPPLIVNKFVDPLRTDQIPFGDERYWHLHYQPNGHRAEVKQHMYLTMKDDRVFGVGYEKIRKLCKIDGKYRHNAAANQTVLAMECKFSNKLDTILLLGTGNGSAFVGNLYIREIDPFSTTIDIPWVSEKMEKLIKFEDVFKSGDRFKGSFILTMNSGMGDHQMRMMMHTRRVHKFAGDLYPDQNGNHYASESLEDDDSTHSRGLKGMVTKMTSRRRSSSARPSDAGGDGSDGGDRADRGGRSILSKLFRGDRRRGWRRGMGYNPPPTSPREQEQPEWVMKDTRAERRSSLSPGRSPTRSPRRKSGTEKRPSQTLKASSAINHLNYLEMDEIPGRSGPNMV